ncbi:NADPH:quinone reductase [Phenylobacterium zucineum HLK1]|uniref:NADPH:quinone reductase n=1 Tax=Phenylobacterium zucineum (strain HLK1) TaxID=450851 RepID=B4RA33_PHEZH|nr:zinc-binding dehydrogenase [Phenylobacterium zucineum]ACG79537.1 NADPH:quinone reductase [Phenylobacterium zucineum HLK1]
MTHKGLELRSLVKSDGELELSLAEVEVADPGPDEVLVRVEATPINPSDLGLLIGPADLSTLRAAGSKDRPVVTATVPPAGLKALKARLDQSMPVGNEGAGVVIAAGASPEAQALMGKTVAMIGGAMYAQYRIVRAADVLALPDDATPAEGASCFVNPLTALGMTETLRREGHKALVHTAAASNLGQMLVRICKADGIPLVNVVRSAEQERLLRDQGAEHVVDSTAPDFMDRLTDAVAATGATLAFDAIGGGRIGGQILSAMEAAANRTAGAYSRYGSSTHKQLYIYGGLDTRPTELVRNFGFAWGVGGWLLTPFLAKIGPEAAGRLRQRVAAELKTTFQSRYTAEIGLAEALDPKVIAAYSRRATGEKYLINPAKGL